MKTTINILRALFVTVLIWLVLTAILYGIFAFGAWEIHLQNWDGPARGLFAIFDLIIFVVSMVLGVQTIDDEW